MGNSLLGKMISYWIFLFGGVFVARVVVGMTGTMETIVLFIILTIAYWGFAVFNERRKSKK